MPFEASRILSTEEVRALIVRLGAKIGLPHDALQDIDRSNDFAAPFIFSATEYHWIVRERGEELKHRTSADLDQLLYWVFDGVTFGLASRFELEHRNPRQDFRRILFQKRIDLMEELDASWRTRLVSALNEILLHAPFTDKEYPRTVS